MEEKNEQKEKKGLFHYLNAGFVKMRKLSESQIFTEKLVAINVLLFIIICTLAVTYLFAGEIISFLFIFTFIVFFIVFTVLSPGYTKVLEIVCNLAVNKTGALRISITILFIGLVVAFTGVVFDILLLVAVSLSAIVLQILVIPLTSLFSSPEKIIEKEVHATDVRTILRDLALIISITQFIIWLLVISKKIQF